MFRTGSFISILALSLLLQACHVSNKDPLYKHEGPAQTELGHNGVQPANSDLTPSASGNEIETFVEKSSEEMSDPLNEYLLPYSDTIFNASWLSQNKKKNISRLTLSLNQFHSALLAGLRDPKTAQEIADSQAVMNYKNALLAGCNELLEECLNLGFFKLDSKSVTMAAWLAGQEKDYRRRFILYKVAYELAVGTRSPFLTEAVFKDSLGLLKTYLKFEQAQNKSRLSLISNDTESKKQFANWLTFLSLNLSQPKTDLDLILNQEDLKTWFHWINSSNASQMLTQKLSQQISEVLAPQLETKAGRAMLTAYIEQDRKNSTDNLTSLAKDLKNNQGTLIKRLGFEAELDHLIGLSKPEDLFTLHYLDQLFSQRPESEIQLYWDKGTQDPVFVQKMMRAVVLVRFLKLTVETHKDIGQFFLNLVEEGRARDELFSRTLDYTDGKLMPKWSIFFGQTQRLKTLFLTRFDRGVVALSDSEESKQLTKTRQLFEGLADNVKYLVIYPNQIMMGYYASKLKYTQVVNFFGEKLILEYKGYLKSLMDGAMPPMFKFVHDDDRHKNRSKLTAMEMTWSLSYSLLLGLPQIYNIETAEFLDVFLRGYKTEVETKLKATWTALIRSLSTSSKIQQGFNLCSHLENGTARTVIIDTKRQLKSLIGSTYLGQTLHKGMDPMKSMIEVFDRPVSKLSISFDEYLELLRSDIDPPIQKMQLIQEVIRMTDASQEVKQKLADLISETVDLKSVSLNDAKAMISQSLPCIRNFAEIEKQRRIDLIKAELVYIEKIFVALEQAQQNREKIAELNQTLLSEYDIQFFNLNNELANDFKSNSGLMIGPTGKVGFSLRPMDFALRTASRIQNNERFLSEGIIKFKIPIDMRELTNSLAGFSSNPASSKIFYLPESGNRDQKLQLFKTQMIQNIVYEMGKIGTNGDLTTDSWFNDRSGNTRMWRSLIKIQTALFKYENTFVEISSPILGCDSCVNDWTKSVTESFNELVDNNLNVLETLSLSETDLWLLDLINLPHFYTYNNPLGPVNLFVENSARPTYSGVLDEAFTYLVSYRLGRGAIFRDLRPSAERSWDAPEVQGIREQAGTRVIPPRIRKFNQALDYYESFKKEEQLMFFKLDEKLLKVIRHAYRWPIEGDLLLADKFIELANQRDTEIELPAIRFNKVYKAGVPSMLNPDLARSYNHQITKFHEATSFVFDSYKNTGN